MTGTFVNFLLAFLILLSIFFIYNISTEKRPILSTKESDFFSVLIGTAQFEAIDKSDIISYRRQDYECQVLVADRHSAEKKYPKAMVISATIDEIMLLYVKGVENR